MNGDLTDWLKQNPLFGVAGLFIVITAFLYSVLLTSAPNDTLTVAFLDVGQGDAVFIEAPNGNQMVIDGGSSARVVRELGSVMPFWDRSIDVVVATHPDTDHIGGLIDVVRRFQVDGLLRSGAESENKADDMLLQAASETDVDVRELRAGDTVRLSPNVHFDVLFPPVDPEGMDPNDASIVGRLVYGDTAVLLSGDAPKVVEEYVVSRYSENLESEVLKVGHHGSDTSSAAAWIGWSGAEYAVISAGEDNRYGHPHQEVLNRLNQFNIEILETANQGSVVFESDGNTIKLKK